MDPDMNKYDLNHRVSHHSARCRMPEWEEAYRAAWHAFYTPEHIETILRRTCANKLGRPSTTLSTILWFYLMILFEGVHPLEGGALRLKFRRDRRSGLPRENPLVFYTKYWGGTALKVFKYARVYLRCKSMLDRALKAEDRWTYSDLAIAPPQGRRVRRAVALSRNHRRRGGARAQEARRQHSRDRPCAG